MILLIIAVLCLEAKIICCNELLVHTNELTEEAKYLAVGLAVTEILNNSSNAAIAKKLSDQFNIVFGEKWSSLVGQQGINLMASQLNPLPNTTLWFSYNTTHIVLFKIWYTNNNYANVSLTSTAFSEVLGTALSLGLTYSHQTSAADSNKKAKISSVILNAMHQNYYEKYNCSFDSGHNWNEELCFYMLAQEISQEFQTYYKTHWSVIVQLVNTGSYYHFSSCKAWIHEYTFGSIITFILIEYY